MDRIDFDNCCQQTKMDGMFAYLEGKTFTSRRGKRAFSKKQFAPADRVQLGEITVLDEDGNTMPRQEGNGILNRWFKKGILEHEIVYTVWDMITVDEYYAKESRRDYRERSKALLDCLPIPGIQMAENFHPKTPAEAQEIYEKLRLRGEEGAIIKNWDSMWKSNTCPTMVKMKHFVQGEFEIVAAIEGKGKYTGKLGALEVKSKEGKIVSRVGSGFPDSLRDLEYWKGKVGEIVTIQFESVSVNKAGEKSLFLPTFIELRDTEKTEADTVEYLEAL